MNLEQLLKKSPEPTLAEEIIDAITHGIGVVLSIAALIILAVTAAQHQDPWKIVSSAIFGSTLIIAYLSSTLYHAIWNPRIKHIFHVMDHLSIYLLIAGTYTPFTLVTLRHNWGWPLFAATWSMAILGIILKVFFIHRFKKLSTISYLVMGWLAIVAIEPIYTALPFMGTVWLVAGGLAYSIGVIFFVSERLRFGHTLWHLFVLAGSTCHFLAILLYVLPL